MQRKEAVQVRVQLYSLKLDSSFLTLSENDMGESLTTACLKSWGDSFLLICAFKTATLLFLSQSNTFYV